MIKKILLFILLISFALFSCKKEAAKNASKSRDDQSYVKSITTDKYENIYDEAGLLKSSIRKSEGQFYFIDGSVSEYDFGEDSLIYTYDKDGRLTRCETYDLDENTLSEIKVYGVNSEEVYILEGTDTISYTKEIVNDQGDIIISERNKKERILSNIILPPEHRRIEIVYDADNRRESYVEYNLRDSILAAHNIIDPKTPEKMFYKYHYQGDTLVGIVYDENNHYFEIIKTITREGFTRTQTYNIFRLLETEDTYKDENQVVVMATKTDHRYETIDSLFFDSNGKVTKYISIAGATHITDFKDMHYTTSYTYDSKGNLLSEEHISLELNNP